MSQSNQYHENVEPTDNVCSTASRATTVGCGCSSDTAKVDGSSDTAKVDGRSACAFESCVSEHCEFDEVTKHHDLDSALFGLDEDRQFDSLSRTLGFKVTRYVQAGVTLQVKLAYGVCRPSPIGWILNGGTSLALAEIAAGLASFALCPKHSHPVGSAVSANHTSMAKLGETLTVNAIALHVGKTTHVVNVDITAEDGRLISTARVTNTIISPQGTEGSAQLQRIEAAKHKS